MKKIFLLAFLVVGVYARDCSDYLNLDNNDFMKKMKSLKQNSRETTHTVDGAEFKVNNNQEFLNKCISLKLLDRNFNTINWLKNLEFLDKTQLSSSEISFFDTAIDKARKYNSSIYKSVFKGFEEKGQTVFFRTEFNPKKGLYLTKEIRVRHDDFTSKTKYLNKSTLNDYVCNNSLDKRLYINQINTNCVHKTEKDLGIEDKEIISSKSTEYSTLETISDNDPLKVSFNRKSNGDYVTTKIVSFFDEMDNQNELEVGAYVHIYKANDRFAYFDLFKRSKKNSDSNIKWHRSKKILKMTKKDSYTLQKFAHTN